MGVIPTFGFRNIRTLWTVFSKYRKHLGVLVVLGSFGAIFEGIGISAIVPLISFLQGGNGAGDNLITKTISWLFSILHITFTFRYLLAFILVLFLFRAAVVVTFAFIRGYITADFLATETKSVMKRIFAASWPFLLKQKIGHIHNSLMRDMQRTSDLLETTSQAVQSWTGFLMYFVVAMNVYPTMTIYTVLAGGVLLFFVRPFMKRSHHLGEDMVKTEKGMSQFLSEHIIGMKTIKAAAVESDAYAYGRSLMETLRKLTVRLMLTRSLSSSLFQPFSVVFVLILFSIMYRSPGFSLVAFAATLYLIQKIFTYLESGQVSLHAINSLIPYAESMAAFKKTLEHHVEPYTKGKLFKFEKELQFDNVSFAYENKKGVLHNMSFTIKRGDILGITGPSGAGKTSIADLLLRLFTPTEGTVRVDGTDVNELDLHSWREHLGYVSQDVFLLNSTIEENIRFYRDIGKEDVIKAAKQANIYDFVMSLPEGFETIVGDRGVMLSGGQRQRVVLARALARKPSLLILDEATSALDAESEGLIQGAIERLHGSITVVIIAHRLTTIAGADMILVVDQGRIVERGTPQELEENPESYFVKSR